MFKKVSIIIASTFAFSLVAATIGLGVVAQGQATCGISQDGIVSLIGSSLSPGSNTLVATPEQLGSAAAGIVGSSPECAVDVVVALCTIRPDAGAIVPAVAGVAPSQATAIQQAATDSCTPGVLPAAGYEGPYDGPFDDNDEDDDDDDFDDDDEDGPSPT